MNYRFILAAGLGAVVLSACAAGVRPKELPPKPARIEPTRQAASPAGADPYASGDPQARVDEQGAVIVEVSPSIIDAAAEQIVFDVSLNTHSIDLGMDLAPLATLVTDTGLSVPAALWDAPRGGHHVGGRLTFPSRQGGASVLEGARHLTLKITDLDAAIRIFEWDLP